MENKLLADRLSNAIAGAAVAMRQCTEAMKQLQRVEYKSEGSKYHK